MQSEEKDCYKNRGKMPEKKDATRDIIQKKSRYGKIFYGCDKYPNCNFALWHEPTGDKCPKCSSLMVRKFLKAGEKVECSSKECKYVKGDSE
ncbi:MAG: topoisomerase DNA-binding C4 zinc finger domain-containing protein [Desulfobacterales bacterium]|nr:topoisomerase DNA-binding C4 zinc finger domain-containing protein [Desulfobacterales bacterium]